MGTWLSNVAQGAIGASGIFPLNIIVAQAEGLKGTEFEKGFALHVVYMRTCELHLECEILHNVRTAD